MLFGQAPVCPKSANIVHSPGSPVNRGLFSSTPGRPRFSRSGLGPARRRTIGLMRTNRASGSGHDSSATQVRLLSADAWFGRNRGDRPQQNQSLERPRMMRTELGCGLSSPTVSAKTSRFIEMRPGRCRCNRVTRRFGEPRPQTRPEQPAAATTRSRQATTRASRCPAAYGHRSAAMRPGSASLRYRCRAEARRPCAGGGDRGIRWHGPARIDFEPERGRCASR